MEAIVNLRHGNSFHNMKNFVLGNVPPAVKPRGLYEK